MVDIAITAANVVPGANAVIERGVAGVAITAGQAVYLNSTTGKYALADTDSATAEVRRPRGLALNGASANQPVAVQSAGDITIGGTIAAGTAYILSRTPGGVAPVADSLAGDYPCIIGMGKSTTVLAIDIQFPGVVKV